MSARSLLLGSSAIALDTTGRAHIALDRPLSTWHIIDGEMVTTDATMPMYDPLSDGSHPTWLMPSATPAVIEQVIASVAQYTCGTDAVWSVERRGDVMRTAAHLIRSKYWNLLRGLITLCFPKSNDEADGELLLLCRWLDSLSAHRIRLLTGYTDGGVGYRYCTSSHAQFLPWGPVSGVWPFNYPVEIVGLQASAALACGNAMVSKPHEYGGLVELALREVFVEAGMPPELWAIVQGYGPDCSALITDPRIQQSVFTGSARVAHLLAAQRPNLRVEDAGLNWIWMQPMWPGANVALAASGIGASAFGLSGQRCSCCRFLFAPGEWIAAGLLDAIYGWTSANLKWGDRSLPALMSWTNDDLIAAYDEMSRLGFTKKFGGEPITEHAWRRPSNVPADRFRFGAATPALFTITPDMLASGDAAIERALLTERFAGNLVVVPWTTPAERAMCVTFINRLPQRLTCGIGTNDPNDVTRLARALRLNGVTNHGPRPWTTGAEEMKRFGPVGGNSAAIGGSDEDVRTVWLARIGVHGAYPDLART